MDISTFTNLLQQHESEALDFKQDLPASSDLAVLISAFYNTRGGTIIIGVDDEQHQPLGVARPQSVEAGIGNIIRDRLSLDIPPKIEIVSYEEIRRMFIEDHGLSYESMAVPGVSLNEISQERVDWYIARRVRGGQIPASSLTELLGKLGVLTTVGDATVPTVAGLLLFGKEPQRFLPHATLRIARFLGTDMTTFLDQADITGTIPQMIDEAEKFVTRNTRHGIRIVGFKHVNVHEYPIEAIREAITNALCHRDWGHVGMQVRVAIFDDHIFVDSPGRLPPGVTLENIEHVHVLRNPIIAQLLYDINYIENWGSGIPRMKKAMSEYDLAPPNFDEPGPNFTVTFHGPGEGFMRELQVQPEWTKGLSERQITAVLHAAEKGKITTGEYRRLVKVAKMTAFRDLGELCERQIIEKVGNGRGTFYRSIQ